MQKETVCATLQIKLCPNRSSTNSFSQIHLYNLMGTEANSTFNSTFNNGQVKVQTSTSYKKMCQNHSRE